MATTLVTQGIWNELTSLARRSTRPGLAAVAYFGSGASKLLPLKAGSRLVVDASEGVVKAGLTNPKELQKFARRGVRIYSVPGLHAKVFVLGSKAFIGSANVSNRSASTLVEAVIATTDRAAVAAAREFVRSLCLHELGPAALKRLAKIYRPPRLPTAVPGRRPRKSGSQVPPMRIAQLDLRDPPHGSEAAQEKGRREARNRRTYRRTHDLDEFWWSGASPHNPGEVVLMVTDEGNGSPYVSPPAGVISTRRWSNGRSRCSFVYVEVPRRRRMRLPRLAKRLGRGAATRLRRGGLVSRHFAQRLLAAWQCPRRGKWT